MAGTIVTVISSPGLSAFGPSLSPSREIAWTLPPTYVFEGMRALIMEHVFRADLMIEAFALNALYFAAAVIAFLALLRSSRRSGSLLQTGE